MDFGRLGPYELRGELGRGAMARVWRAWDPNLEREVAIKEPFIDERLSQTMLDELGRRFVAEARVAARLNHPGIVTIYAADVWDGRPAIVMELVEGATLAQVLRHGALDPAQALPLLDQLLDAVGYAHEQGVVHRDIKPDNVFVTPAGRVKLADFGIAHLDGAMGTMAGTVLGTPGYMAPEQATGRAVDARSDLFSVGAMAYEMLAGKNPFGADSGANVTTVIYRIVHEPVPELPADATEGLPADLRPAIMAALAKDPAYRPQTAAEFAAMLHGQMAPPLDPYQGASGPAPTGGSAPTGGVVRSNVDFATTQGGAVPSAFGKSASRAPEPPRGGMPGWVPYVAVAGVAAVVLGFVLGSALRAPNGGAAGGGDVVTEPVGSTYYVGISNGRIAIFTNSSDEPYERSKIRVRNLSDSSVEALEAGIPAESYEEAADIVSEYRQESRANKAKREAEEAAAAAAAAEAAGSTVHLTVIAANGATLSGDVHRQGTTERVFPNSNTELISEADALALTDAERCVAWNEIIAASNGYVFKNAGLRDYFQTQCTSWYVPNAGANSGGSYAAGSAAQRNVELLQSIQRSRDARWLNLQM